MEMAFHFESQSLLSSNHSLLLNPIEKTTIFTSHLINFTSKFPNFHSSHSLPHQTQMQNPIVCRRKNRRSSGSQKFMKFLPKLISSMASNLKMLPEPLDLIIAEIGGGDGGNSGFWKGFGGGNSDGWWRRKGHKSLLVLRVLAIWGLGLILFGKDLKNETLCGVLVLGFFVPILFERLKRGRRVKDWILDVCLVGVLMGWRLRREDVLQWVQKIRVCSPLMELVKGKKTTSRRRRRRIL